MFRSHVFCPGPSKDVPNGCLDVPGRKRSDHRLGSMDYNLLGIPWGFSNPPDEKITLDPSKLPKPGHPRIVNIGSHFFATPSGSRPHTNLLVRVRKTLRSISRSIWLPVTVGCGNRDGNLGGRCGQPLRKEKAIYFWVTKKGCLLPLRVYQFRVKMDILHDTVGVPLVLDVLIRLYVYMFRILHLICWL